jgi:nitronate monooxygenase
MKTIQSGPEVEALFGASVPVLQAGMGGVAQPELAAAVCEAGAFGMIGLYRHTDDEIAELLAATRRLTAKRFGVNFVPFVLDDAVLATRIAGVEASGCNPVITFFGLPSRAVLAGISPSTDFGVQAGNEAEIEQAFAAGARFCVLQTREAGGHHLGTCTRDEAFARAGQLGVARRLVFISGGFSRAAEVRAALDAGFAGVLCGTVFAATVESAAHDRYKRAIVEARPEHTVVTDRFGIGWHTHSHRVIRNRTCSGQLPSTIIGTSTYFGRRYPIPRYSVAVPTRDTDGDITDMALYCGTSCKDVRAVRSVAQVLRELTGGAHADTSHRSQPERGSHAH